jgi:hypothetical protein
MNEAPAPVTSAALAANTDDAARTATAARDLKAWITGWLLGWMKVRGVPPGAHSITVR